MTADVRKRVMLADDGPRADWLESQLKERWGARVCRVVNEAQIQDEDAAERFGAAIIAFGFNRPSHIKLATEFAHLKPVLVVDRPGIPRPTSAPFGHRIVVPRTPADPGWAPSDMMTAIQLLEVVLGQMRKPLPQIRNLAELDPSLNSDAFDASLNLQVRWIDARARFDVGVEVVRELAGQLLPEAIAEFEVHQLAQGHSGSKVFRVSFCDPEAAGEKVDRVLKLTSRGARYQKWKSDNELEHYDNIQGTLGSESVTRAIPKVFGMRGSGGAGPQPAEHDDWQAVMYSFLGGKRLEVTDLEGMLLHPNKQAERLLAAAKLRGKPRELPTLAVTELLLLLADWYGRGRGLVTKALWSAKEAKGDAPPAFPPYALRPWDKLNLVETLESLDAYGQSLLGDEAWTADCKAVFQAASLQAEPGGFMDRLFADQAILIGPVHGDLNANNVLFALNHSPPIPLLIDFACFQKHGHLLQDYARLELAIKLELVGREKVDPRKKKGRRGMDLDCALFDPWCDAERALISDLASDQEGVVSRGSSKAVDQAFALVREVQKQARQLHGDLGRRAWEAAGHHGALPDFETGYLAALLYHTLRAVGYASLPHLKRVLAVFSVGRIVEMLRTAKLDAGTDPTTMASIQA